MADLAFCATFAAVRPKWAKSFGAGAEAPKPDKPTVTVSETVTVLSDSGAHNQYAEPGIGPQTVVGPDTLVWSPSGEGTQPMQIPMPVDAGYRPHDDVPPSTRKWWHLGRNRD